MAPTAYKTYDSITDMAKDIGVRSGTVLKMVSNGQAIREGTKIKMEINKENMFLIIKSHKIEEPKWCQVHGYGHGFDLTVVLNDGTKFGATLKSEGEDVIVKEKPKMLTEDEIKDVVWATLQFYLLNF